MSCQNSQKKGITNLAILCLIFLQIFWGCTKSDDNTPKIEANLPPTSFTITPENVTDKSAKIIWTAAKDPENQDVTYDIYLSSQLVESQTKLLTITFEELLPETNYMGKVVATDGENSTSINFSFDTTSLILQIYDGNVLLGTQQEVIDFGENHYNIIDGSLKIGNFGNGQAPTDINDLSPLADLIEVTESLDIFVTLSESLEGLNNLSAIGHSLTIVGNSKLVNLERLESLETLNEALIIASNDALNSLSGLQNLMQVEDLIIFDCNSLKNLGGLQNISVNDELRIVKNNALIDLTALSKITIIDKFNIEENQSLTNINGLENLQSVGRYFKIIGNESLVNLDGLSNLSSVGKSGSFTSQFFYWGLIITNNLALESIDGLQTMTTIEGNLVLNTNPLLSDLNGLSNLTKVEASFWLFENNLIKNLDALLSLTYVHSDLRISQNESLENLDGLGSLNYLGGSLQVDSNSSLGSICGLQNLMINNIRNTRAEGISNNAFVPMNGFITRESIIDGECSL